jgi:transcriptional regulator with XRE-family HTH domain
MKFGEYIKEQRLLLGISSRKLSEKIGKSSSYISSIENGLYKTDYIMAYKILKELRIKTSEDTILEFLQNLGIEVPTVTGMPDSVLFNYPNQLGSKDENIDAAKKREPSYQKLYENRQEELIQKLKEVMCQIKDDLYLNYPSEYEDCEEDYEFERIEKFLTTFINIMLGENCEVEVFNKFYSLMGLPLFKLNPVQFQKLIDYTNNLLEYEYVFESGEKSKTQKYPHYRVKYKENN